jgi:DNA-binding CsgD family transcriptional regulator
LTGSGDFGPADLLADVLRASGLQLWLLEPHINRRQTWTKSNYALHFCPHFNHPVAARNRFGLHDGQLHLHPSGRRHRPDPSADNPGEQSHLTTRRNLFDNQIKLSKTEAAIMKKYVARIYPDGETAIPSFPKKPKDSTAKRQIEQLTSREIEVLQFVAEGKLNKEAALELRISIKTIEKHRENLMKKLGIHGIAGLTHFAIYTGIIQCNPQLAMA